MENKQKRAPKTARSQYEVYLNYLVQNEEFRWNKFDPKSPDLLKKHWKDLTTLLNSAGGPKRDVESWKRVFVMWKSQTKKKARLLQLDGLKTGGGESEAKQLSDLEERLLSLIGTVVVTGITNLPEAGINNDAVVEVEDNQLLNESDLASIPIVFEEDVPPCNTPMPESSSTSQIQQITKQDITRKRQVKSKVHPESASERAAKVFQLSQERNTTVIQNICTELGGIRKAMEKMADAMMLIAQTNAAVAINQHGSN